MDDFARNLRLLCAYHGSVAQVCRRLEINRTQVNRYLSGESRPSRRNLQRLLDFFGVDEHEVHLPHDQFARLVRLRPSDGGGNWRPPRPLEQMLAEARRQQSQLSRYHGFYFKYFRSFSSPDCVLRSLVHVHAAEGLTAYKTVERLQLLPDGVRGPIFKYEGVLFLKGARLHMFDYERLVGLEVSHTILYAPNQSRPTRLFGMIMGVSGTEAHQPVAARTVLERVGTDANRRQALRSCGLLRPDDPGLDPEMTAYLHEPAPPALRAPAPGGGLGR